VPFGLCTDSVASSVEDFWLVEKINLAARKGAQSNLYICNFVIIQCVLFIEYLNTIKYLNIALLRRNFHQLAMSLITKDARWG
jgi:hypothetical protein